MCSWIHCSEYPQIESFNTGVQMKYKKRNNFFLKAQLCMKLCKVDNFFSELKEANLNNDKINCTIDCEVI